MSIENIPVSSIMVKDVKTVKDNDSLQHACKVMKAAGIGSVVVVGSDGKGETVPLGIITERDVVGHIALDPSKARSPVQDLMSSPLLTIPPDTSLRDALRIIVSRDIRRLPVVEGGKLVGIVTDKDIYRAISKNESLIAGLISDELLVKHIEELQQPWVYKLGEILHKRVDDNTA